MADRQDSRGSRKLRAWRESQALTYEQLTSKLGLSVIQIFAIETGEVRPDRAVRLRIQRATSRVVKPVDWESE